MLNAVIANAAASAHAFSLKRRERALDSIRSQFVIYLRVGASRRLVVKCGFLVSEMLIVVTRPATGTSRSCAHPVSRGDHLPRDILHNVTTFYERPAAFCRATSRSQFNHSSVLVIEARRWLGQIAGCREKGPARRPAG